MTLKWQGNAGESEVLAQVGSDGCHGAQKLGCFQHAGRVQGTRPSPLSAALAVAADYCRAILDPCGSRLLLAPGAAVASAPDTCNPCCQATSRSRASPASATPRQNGSSGTPLRRRQYRRSPLQPRTPILLYLVLHALNIWAAVPEEAITMQAITI